MIVKAKTKNKANVIMFFAKESAFNSNDINY